ncbi:MAG: hypothetical protein AAF950_12855 [Pseudomonadota bacterium]
MVIVLLFAFLAIIHFLPAVAAIAPGQLTSLYGVEPTNTPLVTLLQHRAILPGLVGGAFACAAAMPAVRWPALIGGAISMIGFPIIAALNNELGGSLRRIAIVDAIGAPALIGLFFLLRQSNQELA